MDQLPIDGWWLLLIVLFRSRSGHMGLTATIEEEKEKTKKPSSSLITVLVFDWSRCACRSSPQAWIDFACIQ